MTDFGVAMLAKPEKQPGEPGERPLALAGDVLRRRIYSPQSYAQVRNCTIVPIVHSECEALASWFPLVWRRREHTFELVAVRGLLNDERAQPPAARILLPLILRAYPFVLDSSEPAGPETPRMLDDVFADAPTDLGATMTTVRSRLSRATLTRYAFMDRFANEIGTTRTIGCELARLDAFEPWPLTFEIEEHRVQIPNLFVIRRSFFEDGSIAPLLEEHGIACARILSLHRLSLFRAGGLLALAKALLKLQKEASREEAGSLGGESLADENLTHNTAERQAYGSGATALVGS